MSTPQEKLLKWIQNRVEGYRGVHVKNFTTSWKDGLAMCALVHACDHRALTFEGLDPANAVENLNIAFDAAEKLGVPRLLDAEDLQIKIPDKLSLITYLGQFPAVYEQVHSQKMQPSLDEAVAKLLTGEEVSSSSTVGVPDQSLLNIFDYEYIAKERTKLLGRPDSLTCQDLSEASKWLQPYWTWVAAQLPPWLAPNLITLGGGAVVLIAYLAVLLAALWNRGEPGFYSYTFLTMVVAIWIFQTADAIDGKQARRVQWSNVLGDFVDHLTDQITMGLAIASGVMAANVWNPFLVLLLVTTLFTQMNMLHWEVSLTGVLILPNGSSITEGQLILMALHLGAFVVPWLFEWNVARSVTLGLIDSELGRVRTFVVLTSALISVYGIVTSVRNALAVTKRHSAQMYEDARCTAILALMASWVAVMDMDALSSHTTLVAFVWTIGCSFIVLGGKLIMKRLCDEPLLLAEPALAPAAFCVAASLLSYTVGLDVRQLACMCAALAAVFLCVHYYVCVMRQIARVKGIPILTLPKNHRAKAN